MNDSAGKAKADSIATGLIKQEICQDMSEGCYRYFSTQAATQLVGRSARLAGLLMTFLLGGCAAMPDAAAPPQQHNNMNAVLWIQTSTEYRANSWTVYQAASAQLASLVEAAGVTGDLDQAAAYGCDAGRHCPGLAEAGLPPAVVLDIDETVLDNSTYQARLVADNDSYSDDTWDLWLAERRAPAVPGVAAFIEAAGQAGVAVVYLTNRTCRQRVSSPDACPQREDTLENMKAVGLPLLSAQDQLIMRAERPEWDQSEKQLRRQYIAGRYRILMSIGDDLGDFAAGIKRGSLAARRAFNEAHGALYGIHWFQLSNPAYGSWEHAVPRPKAQALSLGKGPGAGNNR
jgi:acid phosphatase